ncbi:MAG TPA: type VI secretion system baseplate subunit TssE [Thermoanaerobaculia bacterium]|nr:type VI secretion system baseplate subunit TssE [Thermoanaerobaculia bacterium]
MDETNVRSPLFDRLVDSNRYEHEARPLRTLDRAGLKLSVRRELELLFNTRSPVPAHRLTSDRTVIDYGIPDFGTFSPRNADDRDRLADVLRRAAVAYEPRLSDIRVRVVPVEGDAMQLVARIEAMLLVDGVREPVSFEAGMDLREGKVVLS